MQTSAHGTPAAVQAPALSLDWAGGVPRRWCARVAQIHPHIAVLEEMAYAQYKRDCKRRVQESDAYKALNAGRSAAQIRVDEIVWKIQDQGCLLHLWHVTAEGAPS